MAQRGPAAAPLGRSKKKRVGQLSCQRPLGTLAVRGSPDYFEKLYMGWDGWEWSIGGPLEDPWKTLGGPVEDPRKTLGGPLEDPWKTFGGPVEDPWRAQGGPLEDPWRTPGGPLEEPWRDPRGSPHMGRSSGRAHVPLAAPRSRNRSHVGPVRGGAQPGSGCGTGSLNL